MFGDSAAHPTPVAPAGTAVIVPPASSTDAGAVTPSTAESAVPNSAPTDATAAPTTPSAEPPTQPAQPLTTGAGGGAVAAP